MSEYLLPLSAVILFHLLIRQPPTMGRTSLANVGLFVCFELRRHEATAVSDQGSYARPLLMLAWVTNVSTSPDLYIEFSTEY